MRPPDDFRTTLLPLLRCPRCEGELSYRPVPVTGLAGEFGALRCGCARYPVLDGIPVLRQGAISVQDHVTHRVDVAGPSADALAGMTLDGRGGAALETLLAFPIRTPNRVQRIPLARAIAESPPLRLAGQAWRRRELRRILADPASESAAGWFSFFYQRTPIGGDIYNYFFYRLAQPRHLTALSLLAAFPPSPRPILDLACGVGHLTHYLLAGPAAHAAIGVDRNFFQLWMARRTVAPGAAFVCASAADRLPFASATFGGVLCADAFHLLPDKPSVVAEMQRVAEDAPIVLACTGNRDVEPREAEEHTPDGYRALLPGRLTCVVGEQSILERYLHRLGPDLRQDDPASALAHDKWISVVAASDPSVMREYARFDHYPHAEGRPIVNPIFLRTPLPDGDEELRFHFPSVWYAFENWQMRAYHPARVALPAAASRALRARAIGDPSLEALIESFVVLGAPDRYVA